MNLQRQLGLEQGRQALRLFKTGIARYLIRNYQEANKVESVVELKYALDTFYFLVMGAFVMLMACGFSMLEAGLVRSKNTAEILTKNIVL